MSDKGQSIYMLGAVRGKDPPCSGHAQMRGTPLTVTAKAVSDESLLAGTEMFARCARDINALGILVTRVLFRIRTSTGPVDS